MDKLVPKRKKKLTALNNIVEHHYWGNDQLSATIQLNQQVCVSGQCWK